MRRIRRPLILFLLAVLPPASALASGQPAVRAVDPAQEPSAAREDVASTPESTPEFTPGPQPGLQPEPQPVLEAEPAADAAPAWTPAPFSANYTVRYDGVPFTATGTRSLRRGDDGTLRFASRIDTWFLDIDESARFRVTADGEFESLAYDYDQRGVGRDKRRILDFDHAAGVLRRRGDRERERPLAARLYDPVSWQLALRRDLARGDAAPGRELHYAITDGGDAKTYRLRVAGRETVDTPAGAMETVRVERLFEAGDERATRIWLAPARDWLLVRLEHTDEDGRTLRLALKPDDADAGSRASD